VEVRALDTPFVGAKVFIPMAVAGILAAVVIGITKTEWYWAILLTGLCFVAVFGAVVWWEKRA
jgi:hypothetical protein